ncbi:class I SAM-dependent methyltransferase [Candidatus Parcubacteria bacterium]|nr:class I SAM-dependent methyltransferase [Candidatus Parcubacteria bacterium]
MTKKDVIKDIYKSGWSSFLKTGKGEYSEGNKFGVGIANIVGTGKKVLDIGCGTGKCLLPIRENNNNVIGVDVSDDALAICKEKDLKVFNLNFEIDDIEEVKVLGPFDVVIVTDVLEHLIDPIIVLKDRIYPLLNKGGRCIATVPNFVFYRYRMEIMMGKISHFNNEDRIGFNPPRPYNLGHKTMFNRENLYETFDLAGFKNVQVEPELLSESLGEFWKKSFFKDSRDFIKKTWPTLLAARFLIIGEK